MPSLTLERAEDDVDSNFDDVDFDAKETAPGGFSRQTTAETQPGGNAIGTSECGSNSTFTASPLAPTMCEQAPVEQRERWADMGSSNDKVGSSNDNVDIGAKASTMGNDMDIAVASFNMGDNMDIGVEASNMDSPDMGTPTLKTQLAALDKEDPDAVLIARGISKLGLSAGETLRDYFAKYGIVTAVHIAYAFKKQNRSKIQQGTPRQTRAPGRCFIVMSSAQERLKILTESTEHFIQDVKVALEPFGAKLGAFEMEP